MKYVSQAWFEPATIAIQAIEVHFGFPKKVQIPNDYSSHDHDLSP